MNSNINTFIQRFAKAFFISILLFTANVYSQISDTLWTENWEGNWTNDWHVTFGTWEVGMPSGGPDTTFNGLNCAATILSGNYTEPVDSRLVRHTTFVVPPASENPRLRLWHWYSFSSGDYGEVQIKVGSGDWATVSETYTSTGCGIWTHCFVDLTPYADSTVQIAFYFHSQKIGYYSNVSSGWYIDDLAIVTGPFTYYDPEDWEAGIRDWYVDFSIWQIGSPTSGPNSAYSGSNCAATILDGNYCEPRISRLISPTFIVPPNSEYPRFRFWHWYSFSSGDIGKVQIKTQNSDWITISETYSSTSCGIWTRCFVDLSSYADSTIQIAFYFYSQKIGYYSNVSSGWYIDDITIETGSMVVNNPEDWESGIDDWYVDFSIWQIGSPTSGPDSAYTGSNCAATILDGNYCEPRTSRLISPVITVPSISSNPYLRFWHWYSFSSGDFGEIKIKTENSNWTTISDTYLNTSGAVWSYPYIDLTAYADSIVQFCFYFYSEKIGYYGNVSSGWYIDDIIINGLTTSLEFVPRKNIPKIYSLQQNYPNPFNPATHIRFSLPKASRVKIEVYNMLGQRVAELLNGRKQAGYHIVQFDGSNFSSGVYFYKIQAGDPSTISGQSFQQVRKMLLVK